jgi:RimJ/RimL family protein N-acetyltransferase
LLLLDPERALTLRNWFRPERPGPQVGAHVLNTGNGACWVDRWPAPRAVLAETVTNYHIAGAVQHFDLGRLRQQVAGVVDTTDALHGSMTGLFPGHVTWERVIFRFAGPVPRANFPGVEVRRLGPADTYHLWGLTHDSSWISKPWGGPVGLAASSMAWGAFVDGRLVSVANSFFLGDAYEDLGVVTEPGYRGRGLSVACVAGLCRDVLDRRHQPSWSTSTDNLASIRVAEKSGFVFERDDVLYVVGVGIPEPAFPGDDGASA